MLKKKMHYNNVSMDEIRIQPAILQTMGAEIAILISLFSEIDYIASITYGNPYDDGYYANKAERKLEEMDKYHEDSKGDIWFTFPLKNNSTKDIVPYEHHKKTYQIFGVYKIPSNKKRKKGLQKTLTWYYISESAYAGMRYYCGWKAKDVFPWKK